ncbi:hypothetical protein QEH68_09655 [Paenarthrobacter sp. OM7]|uniref:hypothetical protein n=1 Tax=Paenarthrobacter sp. OM7 TaxID=3041264 RepID=UPI00246911BB|nr:hypothetical protein [Paenarthrobacter sp. OM7]WGM22409.1 hypothetical protein QEH68_09655 [Paenarthrobacter sp. OM7]
MDLQVLELPDLEVSVQGVREIPETVRDAMAGLTGRQPTNLSGKGRAQGVFTGQNRRNRLHILQPPVGWLVSLAKPALGAPVDQPCRA